MAPHWPRPWGLEADPVHQLVIDDELRSAGVRRPVNPIGIGWAGPTLLHAGTQEQKDRHLMPLLSGEDMWCQLFSEPGAGSDLAALSTRAVRDGDEWVVTGQKIWTSLAQHARYGILIARTDRPDGVEAQGHLVLRVPDGPARHHDPAHHRDDRGAHVQRGVPRRGPAARPRTWSATRARAGAWPRSRWRTSGSRCRRAARCGARGRRAAISSTWSRARGGVDDPVLRQRVVDLHIEGEILRLIRLRTVSAAIRGRGARARGVDPQGAGRRARPARVRPGQGPDRRRRDADRPGPAGRAGRPWHHGFLFAPALTVGGGTGEVQRNIIAERVLGLPHEPDVERPAAAR